MCTSYGKSKKNISTGCHNSTNKICTTLYPVIQTVMDQWDHKQQYCCSGDVHFITKTKMYGTKYDCYVTIMLYTIHCCS